MGWGGGEGRGGERRGGERRGGEGREGRGGEGWGGEGRRGEGRGEGEHMSGIFATEVGLWGPKCLLSSNKFTTQFTLEHPHNSFLYSTSAHDNGL